MSGTTVQPGAPAPHGQRTVVPAPPPGGPDRSPGAAVGVVALRTRQTLEVVRAWLQGTPGRLRASGIACVIASLAFAGLAGWSLQSRASALAQARQHAGQLVRVQQIASSVVEADSQFTNGYLSFGQDSADQLKAYDTAVTEASRLIAIAAQAEPADAGELATVGDALSQYTARVAAARANNRQGFQVGVGYLRQASTLLRSDTASPNLLPTLNRLAADNARRVDEAFAASRAATWLLVLAGVLGLGMLAVAQLWVAVRSHRFVNTPLAAATGAVLIAVIGGGAVMAVTQSKADQVRDDSYAATLALAEARISAYVGKSYQSITLIYIGTGGDYLASHKAYQGQVDTTKAKLGAATAAGAGADVGVAQLANWTKANSDLYTQAQTDWTTAASQATSGSVNDLFALFDKASREALDRQSSAVDDGLAGTRVPLVVVAWLAVLLGIVAAVASWLGVSLRLEEYR